jgi:hypothetical protein
MVNEDTEELDHDYTQDRQSFDGLSSYQESHCKLLLDYAKDNLCQNTYESIDDYFTMLWDKSITPRYKDRIEAREKLQIALRFVDKETIYTFLTKEALTKDEEEMYLEYGVASAEGINNEH